MNPFYCAYYSSVFDRNRGRKGLKITQQGLTKYRQHVYRFVEGGREGRRGDRIIIQTQKFPPTVHFFYSTIIKYMPVYTLHISRRSTNKFRIVESRGRGRKKIK